MKSLQPTPSRFWPAMSATLFLIGVLGIQAQSTPRTQFLSPILKPILKPILQPVTGISVSVNGTLLDQLGLGFLLNGFQSGGGLILNATATGISFGNAQWYLNGDPIPGATGSRLSLSNISIADGGLYQIVYFDKSGFFESEIIPVQINAPWLNFEDAFQARGQISGFQGSGRGIIDGASVESAEPLTTLIPLNQSKWISWVAPADGLASLSTAGSQFDTVLSVFENPAGGLEDLIPIATDDDGADYHNSLVQFNAVQGVRYEIRIAGYEEQSEGTFVLQWALDQVAGILPVILAQPQSVTLNRGDSLFLSVALDGLVPVQLQWLVNGNPIANENQSILSVQNIQDSDVGQYQLLITVGGLSVLSDPAEVQINTQGLNLAFRDKLSEAIAEGFNVASWNETVLSKNPTFYSDADVKNKQRAAGGLVKSGAGVIGASPERSLIPSNATKAELRGRGVQGYSGTQVFSTYGGSNDPDEPKHCNIPGGSSYWLSWKAPSSGTMFMDTDGSNYDTTLTVYTVGNYGYGYQSLQRVSCNDDKSSGASTSRIRFGAKKDVYYIIVVDGYYGDRGSAYLNYYLSAY